jgi:hypothetical protein
MKTIHRAAWYCIVRNDAGEDVRVRRASWSTPGRGFHRFEATCSCGWTTRTGGAIPAAIQRMIDAHRAEAYADLAITAEVVR